MQKRPDGPKGYHVREAILDYLDEHEDHLIALARLAKGGERTSLEQLEKELGLDD